MFKEKYMICSVYDTETCNIGEKERARAYPILFIDNDIRDIDLREYEPDRDDKVSFYRYGEEMLAKIDEYILFGEIVGKVPIICAYNLMFDLQPLMYELNLKYDIKANAQSSTNVYTLDLYNKGEDKKLLRFWDTYHLEMRGLAAMGETCGLAKAKGDWDYSLIRTPETPLTELELYYAKRDVQVIPAYLKFLLHANEWAKQEDFGCRIITKTSIVRQMTRKKIARLEVTKRDGKKLSLGKAFNELCMKELPKTYNQYGLRKACFRGGFTFTSAAHCGEIVHDVISTDVVSMHHTFICGRFVPQDFKVEEPYILKSKFERVINTSLDYILEHYYMPFTCAFHIRVKFKNVRLRKNTVFEKHGIALESTSKFKREIVQDVDDSMSETGLLQDNDIRKHGWYDRFKGAIIALGKVYSADEMVIHLNEIEAWCFNQVYEYDSYTIIFGEGTNNFKRPPDYVTLQSNKLFEAKSAVKYTLAHYTEGTPYTEKISNQIPDGIAEELRNGTCNKDFLNQYYISTVKGMFNGIYGTQAQDIYKPSFICEDGELSVDKENITCEENWESKQPNSCKVYYTYGMRIVAGSRMHLIIAMILLDKMCPNCYITGGDTDSLKVACNYCISEDTVNNALLPLKEAAKDAIDMCMERLRDTFPNDASELTDIGSFEIENSGKHYDYHIEYWNKCRISVDDKIHITCAGLARPIGQFHIADFLTKMAEKYGVESAIINCFGYNVYVSHDISHALEHYRPKPSDKFEREIIDYTGKKTYVSLYQTIALYDSGRYIGETTKLTNKASLNYIKDVYNRDLRSDLRYLYIEDGYAKLYVEGYEVPEMGVKL